MFNMRRVLAGMTSVIGINVVTSTDIHDKSAQHFDFVRFSHSTWISWMTEATVRCIFQYLRRQTLTVRLSLVYLNRVCFRSLTHGHQPVKRTCTSQHPLLARVVYDLLFPPSHHHSQSMTKRSTLTISFLMVCLLLRTWWFVDRTSRQRTSELSVLTGWLNITWIQAMANLIKSHSLSFPQENPMITMYIELQVRLSSSNDLYHLYYSLTISTRMYIILL